MMRMKKFPLVLGVAVAVIGMSAVAVGIRQSHHLAHKQAVYYCPMHPTYTSDRPGDCPICSMKLVRRDETSPPPSIAHGPQHDHKPPQDICYLHNCPKMHEGQPCPMVVVAKAGERV
ncbi:MAG: hypothetical protein HYZ89_07545, partial [Candidatus Omnitrophica bacterium]|nr:hypothetical protein [Candidatus Omnitrophota bacterium]